MGEAAEAVEDATREWLDRFDNRRLPEPIGNSPPAEAEADVVTALDPGAMAASLNETGLWQTRRGSQPGLPGRAAGASSPSAPPDLPVTDAGPARDPPAQPARPWRSAAWHTGAQRPPPRARPRFQHASPRHAPRPRNAAKWVDSTGCPDEPWRCGDGVVMERALRSDAVSRPLSSCTPGLLFWGPLSGP